MKALRKKLLNKSSISLLLVGVISFTIIAGAALAVPVPVLALSAGGIKTTIASIVISLLLQCGVGIVDQTYLNKLNNAYGAESQFGTIEDMVANGLLVDENGTLTDAGLEAAIQNVPEYEELFLGDMFSVAEGAAVGVAAGSGAHNIMTAAINCGTLGTIGAFAGAATVGVGLGVLLSNVTTKLVDYVKNGRPISINSVFNGLNATDRVYRLQYYTDYRGEFYYNVIVSENTYVLQSNNNSNMTFKVYATNRNKFTFKLIESLKKESGIENIFRTIYDFEKTYPDDSGANLNVLFPSMPKGTLLTLAQYEQLVNGELNVEPFRTSYITGPDGNQYFNNSQNNAPGIRSMVPEGSDMTPVDMDEYMNYVNTANDNFNNGVVDTTIQGTEFTDFVNNYIVDAPEVPVNPEDTYNPTIPDSSNPTIPDQPTIPTKPDITIGDRDNSLIGTTEGLQNVFPFCIPFDIYALLTGLSAERRAPSLHVPLGEGHYLDVDLQDYESVAQILRALELIAFIIGLAVATRSLIGAKG